MIPPLTRLTLLLGSWARLAAGLRHRTRAASQRPRPVEVTIKIDAEPAIAATEESAAAAERLAAAMGTAAQRRAADQAAAETRLADDGIARRRPVPLPPSSREHSGPGQWPSSEARVLADLARLTTSEGSPLAACQKKWGRPLDARRSTDRERP